MYMYMHVYNVHPCPCTSYTCKYHAQTEVKRGHCHVPIPEREAVMRGYQLSFLLLDLLEQQSNVSFKPLLVRRLDLLPTLLLLLLHTWCRGGEGGGGEGRRVCACVYYFIFVRTCRIICTCALHMHEHVCVCVSVVKGIFSTVIAL